MNEKQTAELVKALHGNGEYAHLNNPQGRKLVEEMNQKKASAAAAEEIIAGGKVRRGE